MGELLKLKEEKSLTFRNVSETRAEIFIYGDIGGYWDDAVRLVDFAKNLRELPDTVNEISVRINSFGGDVFEGFSIYNLLKQHSAKVIVYIDGAAMSIASIIALAGDEVIAGEGSIFMIHKPWTFSAGNANDMSNTIDTLDLIEDQLINVYRKNSTLSKVELKGLLAAETMFDADQAIEKGFIDRKMEDGEQSNIAASLNVNRATWINKKPTMKSVNEEAKKTINNFTKQAQEFLARK